MGNVYNKLLQHNTPTARGLTCCKILLRHWALRKLWFTKLPFGGGGGGGGGKTISGSWPITTMSRLLASGLVKTLLC